MSETETLQAGEINAIRQRLGQLNTKAYYLLVALSFIFIRENESAGSLKVALSLNALAAVLPLQDLAKSKFWLGAIRWFKVIALTLALGFTLYWVGCVAGTSK